MDIGVKSAVAERSSALEGQETFAELFKRSQIGDCVNSIAHDLNNYLGAILSYAELASMEQGASAESKRMTGEIVSAVQKSSALLSTISSISRPERPNAVFCDVAALVERVVDLRRFEFGRNRIQVQTYVVNEPGSLIVDQPKFARALLYILLNAAESAAESDAPRVRVTVTGFRDKVEIGIDDSGPDIADDDMPFVFEPFFTTKGGGHLGLGLTQAHEIALLHRGELDYEPDSGFTLTVPRNTGLDL